MDFTFSDIFRTTLSPLQVVATLVIALAIGLFLFFIYRKTFGGVMYSRNFNVSLIMLTMVSSLMLMLINNSLALSLGMVGALSIIRFRTAVKDPIDTVFMFWAVGEGIAVGTKFFDIAVIAAVVIGVVMLLLSALRGKGSQPYLLIIHYDEAASGQIKQLVKQLPGGRLKSKTVQRDGIELTMEVRLRENETAFVEKFLRVEGVFDAALISHQGDIVS
ncbi:MAG: hypothetical protein BWY35_01695 [Firmicutes bacterium ADurb.Bin248]|nr:MAG: hypothetical protein BWY35_01695 [Firmicutes bacterium ADurb.Bin248]HOG00642.1 DUF4956 domain-containing protein [Clostridia bacterium]HPK14673.1 DUF4956 domain-containing protein [Clostridia bacterium]